MTEEPRTTATTVTTAEENWQAFLDSIGNEEERDRWIRRTTKERLVELIEKLRLDLENKNDLESTLRKDIMDKQAQMTTNQTDIDNLRTDLNDMKSRRDTLATQIKDETEAKETAEKQLLVVRSHLEDAESNVAELTARLDLKTANDSDNQDDQSRVLLVADKYRLAALQRIKLKANVDQYTDAQSLNDILQMLQDETHLEQLYTYDKIVILVGMEDINDGCDGFITFRRAQKVIKGLLNLKVEVAIAQMPPMMDKRGTDSSLFNTKLAEIMWEDVQVINVKLKLGDFTKDQLIKQDGISLSKEYLDILADVVNSDVTIPEKKCKPAREKMDKENAKVSQKAGPAQRSGTSQASGAPKPGEKSKFMRIDKNYMGLVIGTRGANIRPVEKATDTKITTVETVDEVSGDEIKGFMITGTEQDIAEAKRKINNMIISARERSNVPQKRNREGGNTPTTYKKAR